MIGWLAMPQGRSFRLENLPFAPASFVDAAALILHPCDDHFSRVSLRGDPHPMILLLKARQSVA